MRRGAGRLFCSKELIKILRRASAEAAIRRLLSSPDQKRDTIMSQALEKWYTKRGRVGQVVGQVDLYAQTSHNSAFAAARLHREPNRPRVLFSPRPDASEEEAF